MQSRIKDILANVQVVATEMEKHTPDGEATAEFKKAMIFLIGGLLVDIHTIALAHAPAVERGKSRD